MSDPPKKGLVDLDLVEKVFNKLLNEEEDDEEVFFDATSEPNTRSTTEETFVDCNSNEQIEDEKLENDKEKDCEQQEMDDDLKAEIIDSLFTILNGFYNKKLIARLMDEFNNDASRVADELGAGLCVGLTQNDASDQPVKTVYAPESKNVFNKKARRANARSNKLSPETLEEAIKIADELAAKQCHNFKHHFESARKFGINDPRSKALSVIARDDKKRAIEHETDADILRASKVTDSMDLHGWSVERGLRYVSLTIQKIREKSPQQQKLEIITGRGKNNPKGRAFVMKEAVMQWLKKMDIKFDFVEYNPGVVNVNLTSVQ